jgi:hypothetical protein
MSLSAANALVQCMKLRSHFNAPLILTDVANCILSCPNLKRIRTTVGEEALNPSSPVCDIPFYAFLNLGAQLMF